MNIFLMCIYIHACVFDRGTESAMLCSIVPRRAVYGFVVNKVSLATRSIIPITQVCCALYSQYHYPILSSQ